MLTSSQQPLYNILRCDSNDKTRTARLQLFTFQWRKSISISLFKELAWSFMISAYSSTNFQITPTFLPTMNSCSNQFDWKSLCTCQIWGMKNSLLCEAKIYSYCHRNYNERSRDLFHILISVSNKFEQNFQQKLISHGSHFHQSTRSLMPIRRQ